MAPEAVNPIPVQPQQQQPTSHFVEMVSAIPVVASALGVAKQVYDNTKTRYEVVGKVEREIVDHLVPQVVTATTKATPQSAQILLSSGLSQLDQYACMGLDLVEKTVPIILEPTPKILETGKKLVDDRIIAPVDNLVEKALEFSEAKVHQLLPAEATPTDDAAAPEEDSPASKKQKLARVQNLGAEVSRRLGQKAFQQYEAIKKVTPADLQKYVSTDVVKVAAANAEKQLAWLKETVEGVIKAVNQEDSDLRKLVDKYTADLKASFAQAIVQIEKVTPANVKDTTIAVYASLSKSLSDFAENFKKITASLSVHPSVATDPYLKTLLDTVNSSIAFFQTYAQSLRHLAVFQKPTSVAAATVPATTESQ